MLFDPSYGIIKLIHILIFGNLFISSALGEPEVCGPSFGAPQCENSEIIENVRSAFIDRYN